ncbi:MAG: type VI secretion system tube protein Hcp [Acidobacteria bacterium]|nr:type VI secretion system tube protein Hcp [Acidobacteriota bacterium]
MAELNQISRADVGKSDIGELLNLIRTLISGPPKMEEYRGTAFLSINGIKGESTHDKHEGEIEVLDFHWSVAQPHAGSASSGSATRTERAHFGDLSIYKAIDTSSPALAHACASGLHLSNAVLQLCRAGGEAQVYMKYTLSDVVITNVRAGGRGYGEKIPLEEISLSYSQIEWEYFPTKVSSGRVEGRKVKNWNLKTNRESS